MRLLKTRKTKLQNVPLSKVRRLCLAASSERVGKHESYSDAGLQETQLQRFRWEARLLRKIIE
jgi:hypothetical protein